MPTPGRRWSGGAAVRRLPPADRGSAGDFCESGHNRDSPSPGSKTRCSGALNDFIGCVSFIKAEVNVS